MLQVRGMNGSNCKSAINNRILHRAPAGLLGDAGFDTFIDWILGKWIFELQKTGCDAHTVLGPSLFFCTVDEKDMI